jgi:membrane protease YdiL (CAAX protease family)
MLSTLHTKALRTLDFRSDLPKKQLQKSVLFWLAYGLGLFSCSAMAQFLPRWLYYWGLGLSASIRAYLITHWFLAKEGRRLHDIGLVLQSASLYRFLGGFMIGTVLLLMMGSSLILFGNLHLQPVQDFDLTRLVVLNLAFIPMAFNEEVGFRAYSLQRLQAGYGLWISQLITALAFATIHILGGSGWFGALVGTGTWSIIYGLSAVWSRGIALPVGVHVAANVWQALVGMKRDIPALWTLASTSSSSANALESTQQIGLVTQLVVMGMGTILLAWLIKKRPL